MVRDVLIENSKAIFSIGPESLSESLNWYPAYYKECIKQYANMVFDICEITDKRKMLMLSRLDIYRDLNSVEKRKGMSGVFLKYGKIYESIKEKILNKDGKTILISITEVTPGNIENFFIEPINSWILLCEDIDKYELLLSMWERDTENFIELMIECKDIVIGFSSSGCDGNSIVVYNYASLKKNQLVTNFMSM